MNAIKLVHGQRVRTMTSTWVNDITVGTIEGYGPDHHEALERAIRLGYPLAWTINPGGGIVPNGVFGKHEVIEAEKKAHETFQILNDDDVVEIEGRFYTVKIMDMQYSEPIHFVPYVVHV